MCPPLPGRHFPRPRMSNHPAPISPVKLDPSDVRVTTERGLVRAFPAVRWFVLLACVLVIHRPSQAPAGDILRGGTPANQKRAAGNSALTSAAAEKARANARDTLARTTKAIQSVQALQNAARNLAVQGGNKLGAQLPVVTDGLGVRGLDLISHNAGVKSVSGKVVDNRSVVTVKQTLQQAILKWTTFNVGKNTTLNFDQSAGGTSAGQWIAFNEVRDPDSNPSQILGRMNAQGQVYVINRNGIIFGGSSQVNAHALVASALPINATLIDRGLLNSSDVQFLFSGLTASLNADNKPLGVDGQLLDTSAKMGDVIVQPGAVLSAPSSVDHVGGRVALVGANVTNQGTISTPDGQTILAAGLQVGMSAHSSKDPSLRGLDVFVGAVKSSDPGAISGEYAGTVTNAGIILTPRADVTITGKTVNQMGVISSSTSVSLNGRVDLNASYGAIANTKYDPADSSTGAPFLYSTAGVVTLGPGSVTRILPEIASAERVVGSELALPSLVGIQGKVIHMESGATILAPGARLPTGTDAVKPVTNTGIAFAGGVWFNSGVWNFVSPASDFVKAGGQVYLDSGATINVAGSTDVSAPLSENILTLQLRGAEFSNSPLNRQNFNVRGIDLTIDIRRQGVFNGFAWVGTPLADASGFVGLIQRNVGELTAAGGTVSISSGGSVIAQKGSTIDVSGGWINYQGGMVSTSRVMYGGHIYDISQATPDKVYDGVYTGKFSQSSSKWGVTKTYATPFMLGDHYDPGYIFGMSGGSIGITAPSLALDGTLSGNTVSGPRQRDVPAASSSLSLNFQAQMLDPAPTYPSYSPTPPVVVFQSGVTQQAASPFHLDASGNPDVLPADRLARVVLSPDLLTDNGFGSLAIKNPDGNIVVPAGEELIAPAKGAITFSAANVDIGGKIVAPGGTLEFNAYSISPTEVERFKRNGGNGATPSPDPNRGMITLGANASLSTAGLVIDDRLSAPAPFSLPLVTAGGTINLNGYSADLASGSVIDVSGGVVLDAFGKRTYGNAGSLSIKTGLDLSLTFVTGGHLKLGSTLKGFAGGQATGGSLALQTMLIQVGGGSSNPDLLLLQPEFFSDGGFASFTLNGFGTLTGSSYAPGLMIAPGTEIDPVVKSYVAAAYGDGASALTLMPVTLAEGVRSPVSLNFGATRVRDDIKGTLLIRGDVVMGTGAVIHAGPSGVVTFNGDTVELLGSVFAPGGSIQVTGAKSLPLPNGVEANALTTVYIGPQSVLSTAGEVLITPDAYGRRTGKVLPGGSITVSGNIVAEAGSVLDVSGASGLLDIAPANLGLTSTLDPLTGASVVPLSSGLTSPLYSRAVVGTRIDSNGGSITLKGSEELFSRARLLGNAGGPTALGGTLSVQSGRFYATGVIAQPNDFNLVVTQNATNLPGRFFANGSGIGLAVLDGNGQPMTGMGYFAVSDFTAGGFDSLTLGGTSGGNVMFSGPVNITARGKLIVASGGVLGADSAVNLKASYIALGMPFQTPLLANQPQNPFNGDGGAFYFSPTFGSGSLTVTADSIDIGNLSLQTIGSASLIADNGDIRGNGTLDIAGSLYLRAAQIYPTTASKFTIAAYDYMDGGVLREGSVTIAASGTKSLPLSAGGTLSIYASNITQGGVLRAPFGVINLGWDGTGTSPQDFISGAGIVSSTTGLPVNSAKIVVTKQITLLSGSVTSVSAIDPLTGQGILIPYGMSVDGKSWIDPAGNDITNGGLPQKAINISSQGIQTNKGSVIDIRGGGDMYAYRWVSGQTGTVDILGSTSAFAVIPGYSSDSAPYGAFNGLGAEALKALNNDPGYVNGKLGVGDQIYLSGGSGLAAGVYTLLPARYALLPGAFLVTPSSGAPIGTFLKADGASFVNGYQFNSLNGERTLPGVFSRFEVAPGSTIAQRAQYDSFFANSFLSTYAAEHNQTVQPLPRDSGQLVFSAGSSLVLNGSVLARSLSGGRGGRVDISSVQDIIIASADLISQLGGGLPNTLLLDSAQLSAFGAESLLIGGVRSVGANGTNVAVKTGNILVSNEGSPLTGSEIILAANNTLTVADNAVIKQTGSLTGPADTLLLGSASVAGSGSGVLLRVSSDVGAQIVRAGVGSPTQANVNLSIGNSAQIGGNSVILDSTSGSRLAGSAVLTGKALSLNSGHISLQLSNPAPPLYQSSTEPVTNGLVLGTAALQGLEGFSSLSLLSYSSIDVYGGGFVGSSSLAHLALHAAQIRGFDALPGDVATFTAKSILIDNSPNGKVLEDKVATGGTLAFEAANIHIGVNKLNIDQYANLLLNASAGLYLDGSGSLVARDGSITANTPFITAARSATQAITASGALVINGTPAGGAVTSGLGGSLALQGSSVDVTSNIVLPSGQLSITAVSGDVVIGGKLDVSGSAQTFYDLTKYTSAGSISITANAGNVVLDAASTIDVAAKSGGGDAGTLFIGAAHGQATLDGTLLGQAGAGGKGGSFSLDVGSLSSLSAMNAKLNGSGFNEARSFRVRTGDVLVDGLATTRSFSLAADLGAINVTGTIDASGTTGGSIFLSAFKGLTLAANSLLDVSAKTFSSAGKGGSVDLETRGDGGATINLLQDSTIDLSVAAAPKLGQFSGTLHLRAPQNAASTDLQVGTINGTIRNASSIVVEGFKVFDLSGRASSEITTADQNNVFNNGIAFLGAAGTTTANYTAMLNRLQGSNPALRFNPDVLTIQAGAEIVRNGDLTLGNTAAGNAADWDLHSYRFGPKGSAGVLTLRATGNLVFLNALSDGFTSSAYNAALLAPSSNLPDNAQSWSYRLTAGADLSAVDFRQVKTMDTLAADKGSLKLGKFSTGVADEDSNKERYTANALKNAYQVIRTGSGDIDISAGRDVQLLNQFASIFTAGTQVKDPTLGGTFDTPVLNARGSDALGGVQQSPSYPAQYSLGGGNVTINAQNDIAHLTTNTLGVLIPDSERELPNNWLYRRGYVDPMGNFGGGAIGTSASTTWSTTWWVDFSNFFEGVGALGGGNVTVNAGRDIANVDAVIPTNARMAARTSSGAVLKPNADNLIELGGGDLMVHAGRNIDAGVYYVESGHGTLKADGSIITNGTRTPSLGSLNGSAALPEETWLPTSLFLGKSSFDVTARGDLLLGPSSNVFLIPEGVNNTYWYKTYFSTYGEAAAVNVQSIGGDVTLRESASLPGGGKNNDAAPENLITSWLRNVQLFSDQNASFYQPWLRLDETKIDYYTVSTSIQPGTLRVTAFAGDININGNINLAPSPTGSLDLAAAGAINGLQVTSTATVNGALTKIWTSAQINLSDAGPLPGIATPIAYQGFVTQETPAYSTSVNILASITTAFTESGSVLGGFGVLQTKQALHAAGVLHAGDTEPVHVYAGEGDISGLTLFSPKQTRIVAGRDITDIAFYIQNTGADDVSVVASGRDIIAYNANSVLRSAARLLGNQISSADHTLEGDIQISGPGTLEVLAGRNLDLGIGPNNIDGTGVGITSIGNGRNPSLPFEGASIIAGAGIGPSFDLGSTSLDFDAFIAQSIKGVNGARYLADYAAASGSSVSTVAAFDALSPEEKKRVALEVFFIVLRDAGRDHNLAGSPGFGNYAAGVAAVSTLFSGSATTGDITTQARDIRTKSGGDITLLAPVGGVILANSVLGSPLAPPGIITESGGNISIVTQNNVDIGISRIFTLRGGNEIIWSSAGNIAAGSSSKTVQSAPPTRVVIDPQSGDVKTDLAGLATGGGIGVLATVAGVAPGSVDLIAPTGSIDAGDAGIRATGNLNIAAVTVLNASNISVGGTSIGAPAAAAPAAPNVGGLTSASNSAGQAAATANTTTAAANKTAPPPEELPSIFNIEVIGYGGGEGEDDEEELKKRKKAVLPQ